MVFQAVGHHKVILNGEKFQMQAHEISRTQMEGGMSLAQGDEVLVVIKDLWIALFVLPVQTVDTVGRLERVVHTLFGAKQFLATEHEWHTLRGKDGSLCQ